MNYILLHRSYGRESMRMTVDSMTEECDLLLKRKDGEWETYIQEEKRTLPLRSIRDILHGNNSIINWGNYIFNNDAYFKVNKPSGISNSSNKRIGRHILQQNKIAVPKTWFFNNIREIVYPVIGRPSHHHGGGEFYVINSIQDLSNLLRKVHIDDFYFSEVFDKTTEYRVHCGHGKVLIMQEKPLVDGELRANQAVNHEKWRVLKWGEFNNDICRESLKAIKALGLDYGAVDIMYNENNGKFSICEVNTSPSINTKYSSGKYAKYFSWIIRHNFPAHFDINEKRLVFTNEILES